MEDMNFDISGLLTEEEANELFESQAAEAETEETEQKNTPTEEGEETQPSESVGEEEENGSNAIPQEGDGSSPNIYSSIASALKKDGIFPDFEDSELDAVKTPDDFAELFEKAITAKFDERQKRIDEALGNGVQPNVVRQYEATLAELDSFTDEMMDSEGEEADNMRRRLIFNELINVRGYSEEKARKEVEKSFKSQSEVDDAKDALAALKAHFQSQYDKIQNDAKQEAQKYKAAQKKQADDFKKMVLEDEVKIGETKLDKNTCQKVYEAIIKPVYKDPDTGNLLTAVQKFQKEKPLEFLKQLGLWYVLTDGGKNTEGFTKQQLKAEKNKNIRELERKINASSLNPDGSLRYASGSEGTADLLLSDDWRIGM